VSSCCFIGGSRKISRLDAEARRRLDRMIEQQLPVVIGDASGADKAVQRYLHARGQALSEGLAGGEIAQACLRL
jgi:hypothetical protein